MKRILALFLALVMCVGILPLSISAKTESDMESVIEKHFSVLGMVLAWMGADDYVAGSESAPDEMVWSYMSFSGLLEDYYHEWDGSFEGYKIHYDDYIALVDETFADHSDMKDYLRSESTSEYPSLTYDESTDEIWWYAGGMGDAVKWVPLNVYESKDKIVVYGYKIDLYGEGITSIEGKREGYDYVVEYDDEFGPMCWTVDDVLRMELKLEDGAWKIAGYEENSWYMLGDALYNRTPDEEDPYSYVTEKHYPFSVVYETEGIGGFYCDLNTQTFGTDRLWYNAEYGYDTYFRPYFPLGFELDKVELCSGDTVSVLEPEDDGWFIFKPEGEVELRVYAKATGSDGIEYPDPMMPERRFITLGMITSWMDADYYDYKSNVVPDSTAWNFMVYGGEAEDFLFTPENSEWFYRMSYDQFIGIIDANFTEHGDMKDYLRNFTDYNDYNAYYDEENDEITWGTIGGMGGPTDWVPSWIMIDRDTITVSGYRSEWFEYDPEDTSLRENYDYVIDYSEYGVSYMQIDQPLLLKMKLEDGLWKVDSFRESNWYILDGALYNRAYSVEGDGSYIVFKNHTFAVSAKNEGFAGYTTDLWTSDFGTYSMWYDADMVEECSFTPAFEEGYELDRVVLYTAGGKQILTPNADGSFSFTPDGDTEIEVYSKLIGSASAGNYTDVSANYGQADVNVDSEQICDSILTAEEAEMVRSGEADAKVYLEVADVSAEVDEQTVAAIEDAAGDNTVTLYLDIDLYKQIGDAERAAVTETADEVKISVRVPNAAIVYDNGKEFKVYRMHDGAVERVRSERDLDDPEILHIYTDRFSTYAIAIGEKEEPVINNPFIDIEEDKWYTEGVLWCYKYGYMAGTSETTFGRKDTMDRQMFATVLAAIDGGEIPEYETTSFDDVAPGKWYSNAIEWAYQNGYASGIGEGVFGRKGAVTREQIALFFHTYSVKKGYNTDLKGDMTKFADADTIHSWAYDAVEWAVGAGLISGTTETTVSPRSSASRAEVALIIKNYVETVIG